MKTISIKFAQANQLVTESSILKAFQAQRRAYMQALGTKELPVEDKPLTKYAIQCFKAFKANHKLCQSAHDHKRLAKFFAVKTATKGIEFLKARKLAK